MSLRTALEDVTEDRTPPADLADRALHRLARHRRTRTRILVTLASTAAAAAIVAPLTVTRPGNSNGSASTQAPPPAHPRYAILSYQDGGSWYAWDPRAHRYIGTGSDAYVPSPDGRWALTVQVDSDHARWSVGRWADAIHGRGLSTYDSMPSALISWAPDSATVVLIDPSGRATTYFDAATGMLTAAPWQTPTGNYTLFGATPGRRGEIVVASLVAGSVRVQTLDRRGRLARSVTVAIPRSPTGTGVPALGRGLSPLSPDGRFLLLQAGLLVDLGEARATRFDTDGPTVDSINGWYDDNHLIRTGPDGSGRPVMSVYDTSGRPVNSLPLTGLGRGITDACLAPIGPDTAGALVF